MKKAFLLIIIILSTASLRAQNTPEEMIESFFRNYEANGASFAVDELYETNPWNGRIQDAINTIKNQLERFDTDLVGEYYGYEKIVSKKLGESYILHAYFMKFDRQFLRVTFQFYKPQSEWRLFIFKFDDSFYEEIEEAARLYHLEMDMD